MSQKYTRVETEKQTIEATKDMATFYRAACVNHTGTTYKADGNEYYTEIISEYLLNNYNLFDQIKKIKRGNYKILSHTGITPRAISNRKEERIALALFRKKFLKPLGIVEDYQIPLKSKCTDDAGKIDLMTFDETTGILRLIELKAPKSKETLLRCVSEIYTYYKTVDIDELKRSYGLEDKCKEIRISALFFKDSTQDKEYESLCDRGNLVHLMRRISYDDVKVELLRFPFEDVKFAASVQQNNNTSIKKNSNNGTENINNSCSSKTTIPCNADIQPTIVKMPIVEQPNGLPIAIIETSDVETKTSDNWEVEILDY